MGARRKLHQVVPTVLTCCGTRFPPDAADDLRLLLRRRAPVTDYARAQIYWLLRCESPRRHLPCPAWHQQRRLPAYKALLRLSAGGDIGGLKAGACLGWTAFLASVYPGLAEEEREKALNRACTNFSRGHSALRKALYQALCMRGMLECSPQEAQQYRDALRELRASAPPVCPACGAKIKCK